MDEIIRIETGHGVIYAYRNHTYTMDPRNNSIYRCTKRRSEFCRVYLLVHPDGSVTIENPHPDEQDGHSHDPVPFVVDRHRMIANMVHEARTTLTPIYDIYRNECARNPAAAIYINFQSIRSRLHAERLAQLPPIPRTLEDLSTILDNLQRYRDIYITSVFSEDAAAVLFSSEELLEAMGRSHDFAADGTFAVCPRLPEMTQFFTIHFRYGQMMIAGVYVIMNRRTTGIYTAIWRALRDRLPNLVMNSFTSDFEMALVNSVREVFPLSRISGCWFHFVKAILARWRDLGLDDTNTLILDMAMTIPLLPSTFFVEAGEILRREADAVQDENIYRFVEYVDNTWLNHPRLTSLYGVADRSNNALESFNLRATARLAGRQRPNIWMLLDNLRALMQDELLDYQRAVQNLVPRRPQNRSITQRSNIISNQQNNLVLGRTNVLSFMQSMRLTHAGLRRRINRMQYATPPDDVGSAISLMDEPHRYDEVLYDLPGPTREPRPTRANSTRGTARGNVRGRPPGRRNTPAASTQSMGEDIRHVLQDVMHEFFSQLVAANRGVAPATPAGISLAEGYRRIATTNAAAHAQTGPQYGLDAEGTAGSTENSQSQVPAEPAESAATTTITPDNNTSTTSDDQTTFDDTNRVCVICLEAPATTAPVPCGHRHFCATCIVRVNAQIYPRCPVCRRYMSSYLTIYN